MAQQVWFRQLGFWSNPFSIKPAAYNYQVFGHDNAINDAMETVKQGGVVFLDGRYGEGKTSILKRIIREFGGNRKLVYYSCNRTENNIDVDGLLRGGVGHIERIFGKKAKDIILLLDEVQDLTNEDCQRIVEKFQDGSFKSIVLVGHNFEKINFTNGLKTLIGNNVFKLNSLKDDDAVEIVRGRIGNLSLLSDEIIKEIFRHSNHNPRKLLKNCEEVCRYAVDRGLLEVTSAHVKTIVDVGQKEAS